MQGKITCAALTLVVLASLTMAVPVRQTGSVLCSSAVSMNSTELLPHPYSCLLYMICDNGRPVVSKCPEGLHFNKDLQVCDWPASSGCVELWQQKKAEKEAAQGVTTADTGTAADSP